MIDWARVRQDFPVTQTGVYFLSAAMSPPPEPVYVAIKEEYKKIMLDGDIHWQKDMKRYRELLKRLAALIRSEPEDLAFVASTSLAMSLIALSFKDQLKEPFNIVSMEEEFPASTIGFEYLKAKMRYVQPRAARYPIEVVLERTDKNTLAVLSSYVQYSTGFRQDLEGLGRELHRREILFIVNATQAIPYYPVDVRTMHIDALTASLHKWGLAGHIGTLFFTSASFRERFPSPIVGWLSVAPEEGSFIHTAKNRPFRVHESAKRYEFGTFNLQPLMGFKAALDYVEAIGLENIRLRIRELGDRLIAGLKELGVSIVSPVDKESERSAIVSFSLGPQNEHCLEALKARRIFVSPRGGHIRVSLNIFNDFTDIDRLLETLKEFNRGSS